MMKKLPERLFRELLRRRSTKAQLKLYMREILS